MLGIGRRAWLIEKPYKKQLQLKLRIFHPYLRSMLIQERDSNRDRQSRKPIATVSQAFCKGPTDRVQQVKGHDQIVEKLGVEKNLHAA